MSGRSSDEEEWKIVGKKGRSVKSGKSESVSKKGESVVSSVSKPVKATVRELTEIRIGRPITPGVRKCRFCKMERPDHYPADCPKVVCRRCGGIGHVMVCCPMVECTFCGSRDHEESRCSLKRTGKPSRSAVEPPQAPPMAKRQRTGEAWPSVSEPGPAPSVVSFADHLASVRSALTGLFGVMDHRETERELAKIEEERSTLQRRFDSEMATLEERKRVWMENREKADAFRAFLPSLNVAARHCGLPPPGMTIEPVSVRIPVTTTGGSGGDGSGRTITSQSG